MKQSKRSVKQVAVAEQQRVTLFHKTWAASFHLVTNSRMLLHEPPMMSTSRALGLRRRVLFV